MNKCYFEDACFFDKIGVIPKENESLDEFIKRAYLTVGYSRYKELEDRNNYPEVPNKLFFEAVKEIQDLIDMNLYWVDARYKDLEKDFVGQCVCTSLTKKETWIYVPVIYIHKKYSINPIIEEVSKPTIRHELVHAGRYSFNFDKLVDDKDADEYIVKWLGNYYGTDKYNVKKFCRGFLNKKLLPANLDQQSKLVDVTREKLKITYGKKNSLYIISRLLDKEMDLISKESDIKYLVRYKPGLKWDIIRKKVFG